MSEAERRANVRAGRDRFHRAYPGFEIEALHAEGRKAHGNTLLGTVRHSYLDA